ncbi:MAG: hypothetical protein EOO43_25620 [Flavobacterium sp.]|nr:MAG: hypothetical protein EOO43_25620 [Flavobacterium sp.]
MIGNLKDTASVFGRLDQMRQQLFNKLSKELGSLDIEARDKMYYDTKGIIKILDSGKENQLNFSFGDFELILSCTILPLSACAIYKTEVIRWSGIEQTVEYVPELSFKVEDAAQGNKAVFYNDGGEATMVTHEYRTRLIHFMIDHETQFINDTSVQK